MAMTIKELKETILNLPDDLEVKVYHNTIHNEIYDSYVANVGAKEEIIFVLDCFWPEETDIEY